jgi:tetratricopeptide (TPR) repeat protein
MRNSSSPKQHDIHPGTSKMKHLGSSHHEVGLTLGNLGIIFRLLNEPDKARETLERALSVLQATDGPDSPMTARASFNLNVLLANVGELSSARQNLDRELRIEEASFGPDHGQVGRTLSLLGGVLAMQGDLPAARQTQERALRILSAAYGPDHAYTQYSQQALNDLLNR